MFEEILDSQPPAPPPIPKPSQAQRIREYIAQYPTARTGDIARALGCPPGKVSHERHFVRRSPKLHIDGSPVVRRAGRPPRPPRIDIGDFNMLDEQGRLTAIAKLAASGDRQELQLAALKALEELQRAKGQGVGPPGPSTNGEAIQRVLDILWAAGPEVSSIAIKQWEESRATQDIPSIGELPASGLEATNVQVEGSPA